MTRVIDKYEGLLPAAVPIVNDGVPQIADGLLEVLEVGVLNFYYIHAACSQSHYSFSYVNGIILNLIDVLEPLVSWVVTAQRVITSILDYDPFVMVGSKLSFCHSVVFLLFYCFKFIIIILALRQPFIVKISILTNFLLKFIFLKTN